jgi:predicted CoA-binding protein
MFLHRCKINSMDIIKQQGRASGESRENCNRYHAMEAIRLKPDVFWMQLNIENREAAELLTGKGIHVVMNRCIKVEHEFLIRQTVL